MVVIRINDVNDLPPYFLQQSYNTTIFEETKHQVKPILQVGGFKLLWCAILSRFFKYSSNDPFCLQQVCIYRIIFFLFKKIFEADKIDPFQFLRQAQVLVLLLDKSNLLFFSVLWMFLYESFCFQQLLTFVRSFWLVCLCFGLSANLDEN